MQTLTLYGVNDLRFEEREIPVPEEGWKLIKVRNAGICGSDIPRIYETGAHRHPLIPGHEFAGEVMEMDASGRPVSTGRRVGVFPLIPCGECPQCRRQQYEMCQNYNYLGSRTDGGFAEYVVAPEWNLLDLPENVSFQDAAMLEPTSVACHAMRQVEILRKSMECTDAAEKVDFSELTVAVCGLGTIGMLLVMLLQDAGVGRILAIGNKTTQREKALELGISEDNFCDVRKTNGTEWLKNHTNGLGVDVYFECIGRPQNILDTVELTVPAGEIVYVGNPAGDVIFPRDLYWKILRKQLTVHGTWNSSYTGDESDDWHYVLGRIASGTLKPRKLITHSYDLAHLEEGLHIMRDKTEDYIKIMCEM